MLPEHQCKKQIFIENKTDILEFELNEHVNNLNQKADKNDAFLAWIKFFDKLI